MSQYPTYYTIGILGTQEIPFPEDMIWCKHCPRAYQDGLGRSKCKVLDRLIFDPTTRWDDCLIQFTGEVRGGTFRNRKEKQ